MSDNIPLDIQMGIIKCVPDLRSLIRFRSVSKSWKSYIDSSRFISGYGTRDTQPHRLLLRYKADGEVKYVSFVQDENDILTQQQQDFAPNVPLLIKQLTDSEVVGSSYGLWCLHGYKNGPSKEMFVIWNPSIRKSVRVGVHCVDNSRGRVIDHFGFGVCPSTYDPTIVKMSYLDRSLEMKDINKWQVEVFTLSSKTWKTIPSSNLPRGSVTISFSTQVAIDRFIYWFAYDRIVTNDDVYSRYKKLILSFDLITHEFKEVHLPDSLANQLSLDISISKLSESLVVSSYTGEAEELVYNVWTMEEEGGVMRSCTKLLTINTPYPPLVRKLLGFGMSGEPIMETEKDDGGIDFTIEVYKPFSEQINDLGINGEKGSFFICPYTETLLLVDHSN